MCMCVRMLVHVCKFLLVCMYVCACMYGKFLSDSNAFMITVRKSRLNESRNA